MILATAGSSGLQDFVQSRHVRLPTEIDRITETVNGKCGRSCHTLRLRNSCH